MKSSVFKLSLAAAIFCIAGGAFAEQAGDTIGSIGIAYLSPDAKLGTLTTTGGGPTGAIITSQLAGASASIDGKTTLSMSVLHLFTDNIGAEFTIGVPPKVTVDLNTPNGAPQSHPGAATAKVLTPALVGKYLFLEPSSAYRPYLGLGLTRVSFSSVSPNKNDATVNAIAGTSTSLSSSWAPVYNFGMIYNINDKWSINGSISYIPIKTDMTLTGPGVGGGPVTTTGTLKINMTDYVLRVGYKF
ncbi:MAG TPA: OmpW family outer membrane protein [Burkholderiaceae bacterium]|jgi:outer membrane protein